MVDRLLDLLNSRNPLDKGFKRALKLSEKEQWMKVVNESIDYLHGLKDELGVPMLSHRRNTFIKGLIVAAKSVRDLALSLLTRKVLPFEYVLTYHFSQDHLELLFSSIRSQGGFNNNPDVRQFKAALRKVLIRASIRGSKYGNCQDFDSGSNAPLFDLKWRKSPLISENQKNKNFETTELTAIYDVIEVEKRMTVYKENIIAYIGGFVVRKLSKSLHCPTCVDALLGQENQHAYYLNLINMKDNGGLVTPSEDVFRILKKCETFFIAYISGQPDDLCIPSTPHVKDMLSLKIRRELHGLRLFDCLSDHDLENIFEVQDLHSTQLIKKVIDYYLQIRFFRYGQHYTSVMIKKCKHGMRQQANKMLIFKGL